MNVLNIFHVLIAIAMVAFILVQRGPGATAGAAFGSGASGTVFGSRGAGSFLSRTTWILSLSFCLISLSMAVIVSRSVSAPEEADLGVVGAPAAMEETLDMPLVEETDTISDLPMMDSPAQPEATDDLPEMEEAMPPASDLEDNPDN